MKSVFSAALTILVISLGSACAQVSSSQTGVAITDDGGRVFFETSGNPDGEPLLMIHGAVVADAYYPLMSEPALSNYYLVRYHRQGYGGSSIPETGGREREAADALAVLDELRIEKTHVAGHSSGGPIALWLAVYQPDRVHSVILIESTPIETVSDRKISIQEARKDEERLLAEARNTPVDPNMVSELPALAVWWGEDWKTEAPKMIPGVIEQVRADISNEWVNSYAFSLYPGDFFDILSKPAIYLLSEGPGEFSERGISTHTENIPGIVIRTVFGVPNHGFQMVAPEPTARAIADWLAENPFD